MTSQASSDVGSIPISYVNILQTLFVFLRLTTVSRQGVIERKLLNDLFNGTSYNKLERPVWNDSEALVVQFGLTLQQIIDVDEKNQILISNIWLDLMWNDYNLVWNESEYGGIKSIRIPPANIWKPDIYMYNSADEDIDSTFPTNVVVSSSGQCQWVPPGLFLSTCKIDITWFPFDDQQCKMKFGSWTYDSSGIDLQPKNENGDISSFIPNGEWELLGVPAVRTAFQYDCCPEQYIDITYTVRIQRRKLYYIFNLVVPCLMMSCLSLLVFSMPPDAGEKITCGVTILLSLTVFLQLVAETMPPTSDAVPLIGMYFACIMLMCSLSMVFTVLVLNYHHRTPDTHEMPEWVKTIICGWLAHLVRVARPTNTSDFMASPDRPKLKKTSTHTSKSSRLTAELLQQRSSRSLLANVLDLQDDLLAFNLTRVKVVDSADQTNNVVDESWNISRQAVNGNPVCASGEAKDEEEEVTWRVSESIPAAGSVGGSTCQQLQTAECSLLVDVLNEVRFLTGRMKQDASLQQVCNDWKFAAMVIDRVCLWMFSIFTLVSTGAILLSAPHVLV